MLSFPTPTCSKLYLDDAEVQVSIDIQIQVPDGVPDNVIRTVTENCRVLKFNKYNFEGLCCMNQKRLGLGLRQPSTKRQLDNGRVLRSESCG